MMPKAVPAVPVSEYQAKMSLRCAGGVKCASVDSSMARNGPISLPLYCSRRSDVLSSHFPSQTRAKTVTQERMAPTSG